MVEELSRSGKKFCTNCGQTIGIHSKFCENCGTKQLVFKQKIRKTVEDIDKKQIRLNKVPKTRKKSKRYFQIEKKYVTTALIIGLALIVGLYISASPIFNVEKVEPSIDEEPANIISDQSSSDSKSPAPVEEPVTSETGSDTSTESNTTPQLPDTSTEESPTEPETASSTEQDEDTTSTSEDSSSSSPSSMRNVDIDLIAVCEKIIDADTIELSNGVRVRLADIDAPESGESGFSRSYNAIRSWIYGKTIYLDVDDIHETDSYGRLVCVVYVKDGSDYKNVNQALWLEGLAEIWDQLNEFDPSKWNLFESLNIVNAVDASAPEPSEDSTEPTIPTGAKYVASKHSDVFHVLSCSYVDRISESNKIFFISLEEAKKSGRRQCYKCSSSTGSTTSSSTSGSKSSSSSDSYSSGSSSGSSSSGGYVASKNSEVFHKAACSYVDSIKESNKIFFSSRSAAINSGRRPCKRCKP
jgi:endonuclease YncB( thermonuclease family)